MYFISGLMMIFFVLIYSKSVKSMIMRAISKILYFHHNICNNDDFEVQDNFVKLSRMKRGLSHNFFIPYDRRHTARMNQYSVDLIKEDNTSTSITQYPGIPYMLSATEMNGKFISVRDEETGRGHIYRKDEVPGYCMELKEDEEKE